MSIVLRTKLLLSLLTFSLTSSALWAEYPERYVQVIVHVPAGGSTDLMARLVTSHLSRRLGVPFVVENYPGAGGEVGYFMLASAKPDGHTIGTITTTSIVTHELTRKKVPYKFHESFIPVAQIVEDPGALVVSSQSPFRSLEELIQSARERPGRISCGGTSLWGAQHVLFKLIEKECGVTLNYIPFDGAAETRNNLLGRHIDLVTSGLSDFDSLIEAQKVRVLAVAAPHRLPEFPATPTFLELGYNVLISSNRGFALPADTPRPIVDRLADTIRTIMSDPAFLADAAKIRIKPTLLYLNSADYQKELDRLYDEMVKMIAESYDKDKWNPNRRQ